MIYLKDLYLHKYIRHSKAKLLSSIVEFSQRNTSDQDLALVLKVIQGKKDRFEVKMGWAYRLQIYVQCIIFFIYTNNLSLHFLEVVPQYLKHFLVSNEWEKASVSETNNHIIFDLHILSLFKTACTGTFPVSLSRNTQQLRI